MNASNNSNYTCFSKSSLANIVQDLKLSCVQLRQEFQIWCTSFSVFSICVLQDDDEKECKPRSISSTFCCRQLCPTFTTLNSYVTAILIHRSSCPSGYSALLESVFISTEIISFPAGFQDHVDPRLTPQAVQVQPEPQLQLPGPEHWQGPMLFEERDVMVCVR